MTKEELKRQVCAAIDAQREKIMEIRAPGMIFEEEETGV